MEMREVRTDIERRCRTTIRRVYVPLCVAMVVTLVACEKTPIPLVPSEITHAQTPHAQSASPRLDTFLGETRHDDEEQVAQKIAFIMEQSVQETPRKYGTAIRDAQPKAHGCVKAQFHVDDSIPPVLAKGVFQPGHTYEAWIRFSKAAPILARLTSPVTAEGWQ